MRALSYGLSDAQRWCGCVAAQWLISQQRTPPGGAGTQSTCITECPIPLSLLLLLLTENEKWPFSVHVVAFSVFALYGILTPFSLNIALSLHQESGTVVLSYCTYRTVRTALYVRTVLLVLYVLFSATFVHSNFCILSSLHSSMLINSQHHSCTISGRIAILTCISFSVNIELTVL